MQRRAFRQTTGQAAIAAGILGTVTTACRPAPGSADVVFDTFRKQYFLDTLRRYPVISTYLGGDGYDASLADVNGTLRDWSPTATEAEVTSLRKLVAAVDAIAASSLSAPAAIDREVLKAQAGYLIRQLSDRRYQ